ncbi:hypothetical protein J6590_077552 [Homalodisca vitripennis]|nr:hypothetical protein J6590_077552 [Homalodisca vitripennis]
MIHWTPINASSPRRTPAYGRSLHRTSQSGGSISASNNVQDNKDVCCKEKYGRKHGNSREQGGHYIRHFVCMFLLDQGRTILGSKGQRPFCPTVP